MTDQPIVHIGENSPEQVAYKLMGAVANAEKKHLSGANCNTDRAWILRTYAQCIRAVRSPQLIDDILR
jgi:hypothetical protein